MTKWIWRAAGLLLPLALFGAPLSGQEWGNLLYAKNDVNVREGRSASASITEALARGDVVRADFLTAGWYAVFSPNTKLRDLSLAKGFVHENGLSEHNPLSGIWYRVLERKHAAVAGGQAFTARVRLLTNDGPSERVLRQIASRVRRERGGHGPAVIWLYLEDMEVPGYAYATVGFDGGGEVAVALNPLAPRATEHLKASGQYRLAELSSLSTESENWGIEQEIASLPAGTRVRVLRAERFPESGLVRCQVRVLDGPHGVGWVFCQDLAGFGNS